MSGKVWSQYQEGIFEWVDKGTGHAVADAKAGSGKTTTLLEAAARLADKGTVLFLAFNKHIAEELNTRLANTNASARTIHSVGNQALGTLIKGTKIDQRKYQQIAQRWVDNNARQFAPEERGEIVAVLVKLVNFARLTLVNTRDAAALDAMCLHFDIEVERPDILFRALPALLEEGKAVAKRDRLIDFTDMIWLPIALNLSLVKYDFLLVDEAQDLGACQLELVMRMMKPKSRILFVGDKCQPVGTGVEVVRQYGNRWNAATTEIVPIENLTIGDEVSSYSIRDGAVYRQPVTGITERPYSGDLIKVSMEDGRSSRYTPNHLCIVSFEAFRDGYCVYLMQKGNQFRVGMSIISMAKDRQSGPAQRMRAEGADALWILEFHKTRNEAYIREQAIAGKFGVPGLMFTPKNGAVEGLCEQAWAFIGNNSRNAIECLTYFGRHLAHPLFVKGAESLMPSNFTNAYSLKRTMITHASNLMTGCLMLPIEGEKIARKNAWQPVTVSKEYYEGMVYSLDVAKYHTYVADGITTHNCQAILGFAGSDNLSIEKIISRTGATVLPLSICYRCPTSHLDLARLIVPSIEARPGAPVGEVLFAKGEDALQKMVKEGDLVICRLTAPLVKECIKLIKNRVSARVRGKDIGKDLVALLKKVAKLEGFSYDQVVAFLESYRERQTEFLRQKGADESLIESLDDRIGCLQVCAENFLEARSVDDLGKEIEALFDDNRPSVWLSTVHRAKGLENDRVFILRPDKLPLRWKDQQGWQFAQEKNLLYVALTRAKQTLVFLGDLPDLCQREEVVQPQLEALEAAAELEAEEVATLVEEGALMASEGFAILADSWEVCYSCGTALQTDVERTNGACNGCMGWTHEYNAPTPPAPVYAAPAPLQQQAAPSLASLELESAIQELDTLVHDHLSMYKQNLIREAAEQVKRLWEAAKAEEEAARPLIPTASHDKHPDLCPIPLCEEWLLEKDEFIYCPTHGGPLSLLHEKARRESQIMGLIEEAREEENANIDS